MTRRRAPATAVAPRPARRGAGRAAAPSLLVLAALPVDADRVSAAEAAVFRALNGVDVLPFVLVWPVMQLGNVLVVPAAAAPRRGSAPVAARRRPAASAARRPTCWRRW